METEESYVILTAENLHAASTKESGHGFTRAQVEHLGFDYPPARGWLKSVIGEVVTKGFYDDFIAAGKISGGMLRRMKRQRPYVTQTQKTPSRGNEKTQLGAQPHENPTPHRANYFFNTPP
jgi:hypothetical protein